NTTCYWGGYDTQSSIEIVAGNFSVKGYIYISTGLFYHFFQGLKECFKTLKGNAHLQSNEMELKLDVLFDGFGHARITGQFEAYDYGENILKFDLRSDQTYLGQALTMLENMYDKYGDDKGAHEKQKLDEKQK